MPYIVAIAAPVGGGKSALVQGLAARWNAAAIDADDYERMTERSPDEIVHWMKNGADFDQLSIPGLADDLERLKRGETIVDPRRHVEVAPTKYVLLETNFGKEHKLSARHIDLLIWIDTPLEIALARRMSEYLNAFLTTSRPETLRNQLAWLRDWLANYTTFTRDLLTMQKERVARNADIVLDGEQDLPTLVRQAAAEIERRLP